LAEQEGKKRVVQQKQAFCAEHVFEGGEANVGRTAINHRISTSEGLVHILSMESTGQGECMKHRVRGEKSQGKKTPPSS